MQNLSRRAGQLLGLLETSERLSVGDAAAALGANRHTLKDNFRLEETSDPGSTGAAPAEVSWLV